MASDYITGTRFLVSFEGIDTASTFLYCFVSIYVFIALSTIFNSIFLYSVVSIYVFMSSTTSHSINSTDNSPFSHSIHPVSVLFCGSFNYASLYESLLQPCYNTN